MNPTRRSDGNCLHYSLQEAAKVHEQRATEASAAQGSGRFRTVHFSHVRPSTSVTYRDRSQLKRSHSDAFDPFLQRLRKDVFVKVGRFGNSYSGDPHASWVKHLFLGTRGDISVNKKMKYIHALHPTIHSIKYWSINAAISFYVNMTKMHFFAGINEFNDSSRAKVEEIHDGLINLMTEKLSLLGALNEKNVRIYTSLFWAMSNSHFIKNSVKSGLLAKNLVEKMTNTFLSYQKQLTPYLYKEVVNYISRLNKIKQYENLFKCLIEKHLVEMSELDNTKETNIDFAKFLYNFSNVLENSFAFVPLGKNIEKLITKIDFSSNINGAYLGLHSITKCLLKSELPLSERMHNKIKECLSFIEKNKKSLNSDSSLSVALSISISILFSKLEEIPEEYLKVLNICQGNLEKNKDKLTLGELNKLLQIIGNLFALNVSFFKFLLLASDVFENKKNDFYTLPKSYLHTFFCKFGLVSKAMVSKDPRQYLSIKAKFSPALRHLTKRYSEYLFVAELSEKINGYRALSTVAVSSFQPNAAVRDILRDLFDSIDKDEKLLDGKNNNLASFLNSTMKLGNLIKLDLDKYTEIFITHTKKLIENNEAEVKKNLMLWAILVFFVTNRKELNENNRQKLKKTIKKSYLNLKEIGGKIDDSTFTIVEFWLKMERAEKCIHESDVSFSQSRMLTKLQAQFRNERFETEVSINNLPPCDIIIPSRNIVIEVQGPHHFLDRDNRYKTGSTLLKLESYRKAGFKVIEICIDGNEENEKQNLNSCIRKIRDVVSKPRFS